MLGGPGGLSPLVNAKNLQISTSVIVFHNILCKSPTCSFDSTTLLLAPVLFK